MRPNRIPVIALLLLTACSASTTTTTTPPAEITSLAPVPTTTTPAPPQTTVPPTLPPSAPAGLCRSYEDPVVVGTVGNPSVTETSGIAVSRTHTDIIWMHNDSGGGPFLYAATLSGEPMGTFELATETFDWEDMSIGPGPEPGRDYLYIGDIGDNFNFRPVVVVHRIVEPVPDPAGGSITEVEAINLLYPDPGYDSESLFVDPVTGDLFVITKPEAGGVALVFRAPAASLVDGATVSLEQVGSFQLEPGLFVTAAAMDTAGSVIGLRGYNEVWIWQREDLSLVETFAAEPCRAPSTAEVQGEAIAFAADGYSYYTMSEGSDPDINYVFSIFD
ncbi:MAG: hypothetical protein QNJ81_08275 [Acidimicrobiia bacterium]|nr:hypothetical protein [Acidimicrobiia bacterium]